MGGRTKLGRGKRREGKKSEWRRRCGGKRERDGMKNKR
jgi:hypothetical protein